MQHFSSQKTVRLIIRRTTVDGKKQILLVHEKDERNRKDERGWGGKPGGWSLPGGGIKNDEKEIFEEIKKLLAVQVRFPKEGGGDRPISPEEYHICFEAFLDIPPFTELKVILTAVKEAMEETGFFIKPVRELFREPNPRSTNNHENVFLECELVAGLLQTHSIETDDARWFDENDLPEKPLPDGLYRSHRPWIKKCLAILDAIKEAEQNETVSLGKEA